MCVCVCVCVHVYIWESSRTLMHSPHERPVTQSFGILLYVFDQEEDADDDDGNGDDW